MCSRSVVSTNDQNNCQVPYYVDLRYELLVVDYSMQERGLGRSYFKQTTCNSVITVITCTLRATVSSLIILWEARSTFQEFDD